MALTGKFLLLALTWGSRPMRDAAREGGGGGCLKPGPCLQQKSINQYFIHPRNVKELVKLVQNTYVPLKIKNIKNLITLIPNKNNLDRTYLV